MSSLQNQSLPGKHKWLEHVSSITDGHVRLRKVATIGQPRKLLFTSQKVKLIAFKKTKGPTLSIWVDTAGLSSTLSQVPSSLLCLPGLSQPGRTPLLAAWPMVNTNSLLQIPRPRLSLLGYYIILFLWEVEWAHLSPVDTLELYAQPCSSTLPSLSLALLMDLRKCTVDSSLKLDRI